MVFEHVSPDQRRFTGRFDDRNQDAQMVEEKIEHIFVKAFGAYGSASLVRKAMSKGKA